MARRTADEVTTRRLENLLGRQEVTARRLVIAQVDEAEQLLVQARRLTEPRPPRHLRVVREAADGV